ncbi:MAG: hypothetical protein ACREPY_12280, partial [Rhodanobacteraceae bacterium]
NILLDSIEFRVVSRKSEGHPANHRPDAMAGADPPLSVATQWPFKPDLSTGSFNRIARGSP